MQKSNIIYALLAFSVAMFILYDLRVDEAATHWTLDEHLRVVIPRDMILIDSSLLWCPNAKSGTTTVYNILWQNNLTASGSRCLHNSNCDMTASEQLRGWSTAKPLSFVIVRNPYERLKSAYISKLLTGKIKLRDGKFRPIKTFAKFVQYVAHHPTGNIHWSPVSSRCLTASSTNKDGANFFHYDYIVKIEDDIPQKLEEIFHRAGIILPAGIEKMPMNQNENKEYEPSGTINFYREAAVEGNVTMEELVASVGQIYSDDIETFGYSFPALEVS